MTFCKDVWGKVIDEVHATYPTTWKDAVKDRWCRGVLSWRHCPTWLRKWLTPHYTVIDKKLYAVYPNLRLPKGAGTAYVLVQPGCEPKGDDSTLVLTPRDRVVLRDLLHAAYYRGDLGLINNEQNEWIASKLEELR